MKYKAPVPCSKLVQSAFKWIVESKRLPSTQSRITILSELLPLNKSVCRQAVKLRDVRKRFYSAKECYSSNNGEKKCNKLKLWQINKGKINGI